MIKTTCLLLIITIKQKGVINMNIKKIGLTALAGSLVATSAFAGEMSVAGGASITVELDRYNIRENKRILPLIVLGRINRHIF